MKVSGKKLSKNDLVFSKFSIVDDVGSVFFWNDRVFRGIYPKASQNILKMFKCGLIKELNDRSYIPYTWISDLKVDGFEIILEHEKIEPIIYPFEWSFEMLRRASLFVLSINSIANRFGFELKDCHGYNVIFKNCSPIFVDIGSFLPCEVSNRLWLAEQEFLKFYYYPLQLWSAGHIYLARKLLIGGSHLIPHESFFRIKNPLSNMISLNTLQKYFSVYFKFKKISTVSSESLKKLLPNNIVKILSLLIKYQILPFQITKVSSLQKKINRIKKPNIVTKWSDYQEKFFYEGDNYIPSPRFRRIREIITSENIKTIVELAGNQGVLSRYLLECGSIKSAVCTDYDEQAVDKMYLKTRLLNINLLPAILDFITPTTFCFGLPVHERLKADAVLALAITHHLILTQKIYIETVFEKLNSFTKKLVFTEFMPIGLWDGKTTLPIPKWYNINWFRKNFKKFFNILYEEILEDNRILFVGLRRS